MMMYKSLSRQPNEMDNLQEKSKQSDYLYERFMLVIL